MHVREQRGPERPDPGFELGRIARGRDYLAERARGGSARGDGRCRFCRELGTDHGRSGQAPVTEGSGSLSRSPTREWASQHLGSRFGKTEAWIFLDTPGDGSEPAYAGLGFKPGIDRAWFADAVRRHDSTAIRGALHRTDVHPGEVYVANAGVPHYLGPRLSFVEVQEPSDHIVIAETSGEDDAGATMDLGWDLALDMIDYTGTDAKATFARARQEPRVIRTSHGSREVRLMNEDVLQFFDATALEVADAIEVADERFSIGIVTAGEGSIVGDFGSMPIRRGDTFALPASSRYGSKPGGSLFASCGA